jgi:hypothetical protein
MMKVIIQVCLLFISIKQLWNIGVRSRSRPRILGLKENSETSEFVYGSVIPVSTNTVSTNVARDTKAKTMFTANSSGYKEASSTPRRSKCELLILESNNSNELLWLDSITCFVRKHSTMRFLFRMHNVSRKVNYDTDFAEEGALYQAFMKEEDIDTKTLK